MLKSEPAAIMTGPIRLFLMFDKILFAFGMVPFPPVTKEEDLFIDMSIDALLAELILIPRLELPAALITGPLPLLLLCAAPLNSSLPRILDP